MILFRNIVGEKIQINYSNIIKIIIIINNINYINYY